MKLLKYLCIACCALTLAACGDDDPTWVPDNGNNNNGGNSANTSITNRMETPRVLNDGSTLLIDHTTTTNGQKIVTYELEYDKNKLHSRWVAFRFDGNTRSKTTGRSDEPFTDDPSIDANYRIGKNGFGWDYNRGHLCASADRLYNVEANVQTFYMTNMSPQLASFNQAYWVTLEGLVQALGRDKTFSDTLYVVKGGTIKDNQIMDYVTRSNGKRVAIPKYYYMALLKVKNGVYSSIAFWMEHKEYGYDYKHKAPLSEIAKNAISVNKLEELTGINFFPNLPDTNEELVESTCDKSAWGM